MRRFFSRCHAEETRLIEAGFLWVAYPEKMSI